MPVTITIDLLREIRALPNDQRKDLFDSLSTECEIIQNVVDQVMVGLTDMGSCGGESTGVDRWIGQYPTPLDTARRHIRIYADTALREQIANLELAAKRERERHASAMAIRDGEMAALQSEVGSLRYERDSLSRSVQCNLETITSLQAERDELHKQMSASQA